MPLVGWWPLTEDSGSTAYDYSGNGHDATIAGATLGVPGLLGGTAISFDGTDDSMTILDAASLDLSLSFTIGAWTNTPASYSVDGYVIRKRQNYGLLIDGAGGGIASIFYDSSAGAWRVWNTGKVVADDQWHCIYLVFEASGTDTTVTAFLDGTRVGSTTQTGQPTFSTNDLGIGWNGSGGEYYNGDIADVRIYDHALSGNEVAYLYEVSHTGSTVLETKS